MRRWLGRLLLLGWAAGAFVIADNLYWRHLGGAFNHR